MIIKRNFIYTPKGKNRPLHIYLPDDYATSLDRYPVLYMFSMAFRPGEQVLSIRQAMLSPGVVLPVEQCEGRILASASVGCPPAVPILICGERINAHAIDCFRYYGIQSVTVL